MAERITAVILDRPTFSSVVIAFIVSLVFVVVTTAGADASPRTGALLASSGRSHTPRIDTAGLSNAPRIALVIGNSLYADRASWPTLSHSIDDARDMAAKLSSEGFELVGNGPQINLTGAGFERVQQDLVSELRLHPGAIVFIYYSGHGLAAENHNLLVPTDASAASTDGGVRVRDIESSASRSGAGIVVMFLDACRESVGGRFVDEKPLENSFVDYASMFGSYSFEAVENHNSFYTSALLKELDGDWSRLEDLHVAIFLDTLKAIEDRAKKDGVVNLLSIQQYPVYRKGWGVQTVPLGDVLKGRLARRASEGRREGDALASECRRLTSDGRVLVQAVMRSSNIFQFEGESVDVDRAWETCHAAYDSGIRSPAVMSGFAYAALALRNRGDSHLSDHDFVRAFAFLFQAAEEGDPWADLTAALMQAYSSSQDKSEEEASIATARFIRAGQSGRPFIGGAAAVFLLPSLQKGSALGSAIHPDENAAARIAVKAARNGDVLATELLALAMERRLRPSFGLPLPSGLDVREILRNTIRHPRSYLGIKGIDGLTPHQFLVILAMWDARLGSYGRVDQDGYIAYARMAEPFFPAFLKSENHPEHSTAEDVACLLGGLSGRRRSVGGDVEAARRFFEIALAAGSPTAAAHLYEIDSYGIAGC